MREIKFRAISTEDDNNGWTYGHYVYYSPLGLTAGKNNEPRHYIVDSDNTIIKINPETLGQFTGLDDKVERRIYEGDIIGNDHIKGVVKFKDGSFQWIYPSNQGSNVLNQERTSRLEIFGNKFDNPNLLKKENNE